MAVGKTHVSEDRLLDLTRGYLSEVEQDETLRHISTCTACESSFAEMLGRQERVRSRGQLVDGDEGLELVQPALEKRARRKPRWRPVVAFGAVAAALGILLLSPHERDDDLILLPLPELGSPVHVRDGARETGGALEAGLEAYRREELRRAIELLSEPIEGPADLLRRVFLGSAQARTGDHTGAIATLGSLPFDSMPDPWGNEARWTLAACLRQVGRLEEADEILRQLAQDPGRVGDRAREVVPAP